MKLHQYIEGRQINGTLLSTQVGPVDNYHLKSSRLLYEITSIWKVPLVDQAGCKTIYGEALHQVNGRVAMPVRAQIFKTDPHNFHQ